MVSSYVAVDLETTGLDPKKDKIIEIGAVLVLNGVIKDTYETFVNPYRKLEERITSLTGIRDEQLESAPGIETVIGEFLDFAGKFPVLGHHVIFDYSFLKRAAVNGGHGFERQGIDTLKLARRFMPPEAKKNLKDACEFFEIKQEQSHRALADSKSAHFLYQELVRRFGSNEPEAFESQPLIYKVKKEQPASNRQKEHLQDLLKYHKIVLSVQTDHLSRNEISRITDKIISQYGRI
ncbi:PolC-type DNA polymerase III [Lacrimispora sp. JR3]|uniref:3'-5' exonuclease n=1 Tax=Lacrimispora sinapis TaxID=3111456 RepID=UPI00374A5916